jgi:hypothetical protein
MPSFDWNSDLSPERRRLEYGRVLNEGEIVVASNEELHAARFSAKRLLALWNAPSGVFDHQLMLRRFLESRRELL